MGVNNPLNIMNQFTQAEIELIERVTGHSIYTDVIREQLSSEYTETVIETAKTILADLSNIDLLIKDALSYSFVLENRQSKLSYSNHIKHLKSEGTRLLNELAHILKISVNYNKYTGTSYNRNTVSYW